MAATASTLVVPWFPSRSRASLLTSRRSSSLSVRGEDDGPFQPLDPNRALPVHSQDRSSAPGGDAVSNDYRVDIPFTASGEYQTELEYVVTAQ